MKTPANTDVAPPYHRNRYPLPKRITIRHIEGWGAGISYGTDYSTLAVLFGPDYKWGSTLPLLDIRAHRFDNNTYAGNFGVAARYLPYPDTFCEMLGINAYYDVRQGHKGVYQQLGVGVEILGKRLDFRGNVYAPVGKKKIKTKCVFDDYDDGFFIIHKECEYTSYGFNAEVGYLAVRSKEFLLYSAAGVYYLAKKCIDKARGFEVRIRPQYKDYLAMEFMVSYDWVFHTVYQAQVMVNLPLYQMTLKKQKPNSCGITDRQIYQPIERYEVLPLAKKSCWHQNF